MRARPFSVAEYGLARLFWKKKAMQVKKLTFRWNAVRRLGSNAMNTAARCLARALSIFTGFTPQRAPHEKSSNMFAHGRVLEAING